jgi:hypothetical protein
LLAIGSSPRFTSTRSIAASSLESDNRVHSSAGSAQTHAYSLRVVQTSCKERPNVTLTH